ncbi:MAG: right-handed parallel beta-helix repeat-containing protein [Lentisphaeria bacterium]|jgi:hypothetical protein|nr:right-handed parallel beta-helix repeat-containing protein [Lentisphaeria bacterium]
MLRLPSLLAVSLILARSLAAQTPGPYPPEMAAWTVADKQLQAEAGKRLLGEIVEAIARGDKTFAVPTGHYRFTETEGVRPCHIRFEGVSHFTLDGSGSTFWFEKQATAIFVNKCADFALRNLTIDWDPLPFTQGTVVAIDPAAGTFDVRLDPGYERVTEALTTATGAGGNIRGALFDPATRLFKTNQWGFSVGPFWNESVGENTYRIRFRGFYGVPIADSGMAVGDRIALWVRQGRAVRIEVSSGIELTDVTLHASGFIALQEAAGGGGTRYRRVRIVRRPDTNRLIAGNADGINCSNLERGPLIEGCEIECIGDDFVNVHTHFARVLAQPAPDELIASRIAFRGTVRENARITLYNRLTLEPLADARVRSSEATTWTPEKGTCLNNLDDRWHSGTAAGLRYVQPNPAVRLVLDRPVELRGEPILLCHDYAGAGTYIANSRFVGSLARGIRLQSPFAEIVNNHLENTCGGGISLQSHPGFWGEGANVHHARIADNTIVDTSIGTTRNGHRYAIDLSTPGDLAVAERQRCIEIANNTILRPGGAAIVVRGAEAVRIVGNRIAEHGNLPVDPPTHGGAPPPGLGHALILHDLKAGVVEGNTIANPGPHALGERFDLQP